VYVSYSNPFHQEHVEGLSQPIPQEINTWSLEGIEFGSIEVCGGLTEHDGFLSCPWHDVIFIVEGSFVDD